MKRKSVAWVVAGTIVLACCVVLWLGIRAWLQILDVGPIERPPETISAEPGLHRFVPKAGRPLLSLQDPLADEEEPPAVALDHAFARTKISGRVYDMETGTGIHPATVRVRPRFKTPQLVTSSADGSVRFSTRKDGSFALKGIPPGIFVLTVDAYGYVPAESSFKKFTEVEDDDGFDVGLSRAGLIEGIVRTEDGFPVEGARIFRLQGRFSMITEATLSAVSDPEGRFVLDPVPTGDITLFAEHPGYASAQRHVAAGASEARSVVMVLEEGSSLSGVVVGDSGPVAGARVTTLMQRVGMRFIAADPRLAGRSVTTDALGEFKVQAGPEGPLALLVEAHGYEPTTEDIRRPALVDGQIEIRLRPSVEFAGRVMGSDGRPIADATVEVRSLAALRVRGVPNAVATDAQGQFSMASAPASGPYEVRVSHHEHPRLLREEAALGTKHEYRMLPAGAILGRIVDASTGEPVTQHWVVASGKSASRSDGVSVSGSYEIDRLEPGTYSVHVGSDGYAPSEQQTVVLAAGGRVLGINFRLVRLGAVSGKVEGYPSGSLVVVRILNADDDVSGHGMVGPDGSFRIDGIAPGSYTVRAELFRRSKGVSGGRLVEQRGVVVGSGEIISGIRLVAPSDTQYKK